jgi:hypothetical protein
MQHEIPGMLFISLLVARYDPDIDGPVAPRSAAKARQAQADADAEAEGEGEGEVAARDVGAMYVVMRERVAKMEARVDERLNQVQHARHAAPSAAPHRRQVESMLCATLLPLAKSLDQLVQQNVDQVRA